MAPGVSYLSRMRPDPRGYLYFIQQGEDGPIKIGKATNPRTRMRELQTANPEPLRLIAAVTNGATYEREVHTALKDARVGPGEWFAPEAVFAFLERIPGTSEVFDRLGFDF